MTKLDLREVMGQIHDNFMEDATGNPSPRRGPSIINRTPHQIEFRYGDLVYGFLPDGEPIRAITEQAELPRVKHPSYGDLSCAGPPRVIGLRGHDSVPRGATVIVSMLAAEPLAKLRPDLEVLTPDGGPGQVVRNSEGQMIGTKRFIRWSERPRQGGSTLWMLWQPEEPQNPLGNWMTVGSFWAHDPNADWFDCLPDPKHVAQAWANMSTIMTIAAPAGESIHGIGVDKLREKTAFPESSDEDRGPAVVIRWLHKKTGEPMSTTIRENPGVEGCCHVEFSAGSGCFRPSDGEIQSSFGRSDQGTPPWALEAIAQAARLMADAS